jgi:serine/threonine protein kinase/Flp pilus assembly protein TadD
MIGRTFSHYKILELLGEGGMGMVYKAEDLTLKRTVALKFISTRAVSNDEDKGRFIREAQAAAAVNHPNICTIYEIDEHEGRPFIAMEYVEGKSLKDKIASGPLPVDEAVEIAIEIAEGLREAHGKGIIHRDIKSSNIMITAAGRVKVMDFGLARFSDQTQVTQSGTTVGTIAYMPPEQGRGDRIDLRADIWSLGVVLYETITGELPFRADYEQATIYLIINEEPPSIRSRRSDVPEDLERIVEKALKKDPAQRFESAESMKQDLEALLNIQRAGTTPKRAGADEPGPSIAVLPFRDMSSDRDQDYFCEGIAEELINALVKLEGLRVVARTSAFQFKDRGSDIKQIGLQLDAKTILEGSVRKSGNRLRITAQLINVEDGFHLWSEKFDRELKDIFVIQDEISLAIVDKLKIRLLGKERRDLVKRYTADQQAHNLYLKGLYFWNRRLEGGMKLAMEHFHLAVEKDPGYALAYVGIADTYGSMGFLGYRPPKEVFPKSKEAARRALEIDDTLGEAHTSLAFINAFFDWDWSAAEAEFKRAIELNPNYATVHEWYGLYLSLMGKFDEAIAETEKARDLDPLSPIINTLSAASYLFAGRFEESIAGLEKTLEFDADFLPATGYIVMAYVANGMCEDAVRTMRRIESSSAEHAYMLGNIGYAYGLCGQADDALRILGVLKKLAKRRYVSPVHEAFVLLGLDRTDEALDLFEKAYVERSPWLLYVGMNVFNQSLRSSTRYQELLRKIGF